VTADEETTNSNYIPGFCNIGKAEARRRFVIGRNAMIVCLVFFGLCLGFEIAPPWRLLIFFPATIAAIGFLQARFHFCAKYGLGGVFNFGGNVGKTDSVEQADFRRQDRRKAIQIIGLSLLIGAAVAFATYFANF
jgi:hypothetical protein